MVILTHCCYSDQSSDCTINNPINTTIRYFEPSVIEITKLCKRITNYHTPCDIRQSPVKLSEIATFLNYILLYNAIPFQ